MDDGCLGFTGQPTLRRPLPSADERRRYGHALRKVVPRDAHGAWSAPADRSDPVKLIAATNARRLQRLVPRRNKRMTESVFAFFRGTAEVMARDLAATPATGLHYAICGDAHAGNFGLYTLPDGQVVLDLNDFDEARPGPWEWDVKRLTTSLVLVARGNGFAAAAQHAAATAAADGYARAIAAAANLGIVERFGGKARVSWQSAQAPTKGIVAGVPRQLVEWRSGEARFRPDKVDRIDAGETSAVFAGLDAYLPSLPAGRDRLLAGYRAVAAAGASIGLGSLGVRNYLVLLQGPTADDILVLQIKEAAGSQLTPSLGPFEPGHLGRWVVVAQRSMQAFIDPLIGWTEVAGRDYSVRKRRASGDALDPTALGLHKLVRFANACGAALGYAHGRCGDPIAVAAYIGGSSRFARAIAHFAASYADQVEDDYARFLGALAQCELPPASTR